jgi:hypothetical protein
MSTNPPASAPADHFFNRPRRGGARGARSSRGTTLAFRRFVRVLEARFHPRHKDGDGFVVVAHLVWDGRPADGIPTVQLAPSPASRAAPATLLSKLQYLVAHTSPDCFERLQTLRSRFWTFVEIAAPADFRWESPR